jgi:hypothetical protein
MVTEQRLDAIATGIEKIKQDKPYDDTADAIAALDWISAATADLRTALGRATADPAALAALQDLLDSLQRLHSSIGAGIKRSGGDVPRRHDDTPAGTVNL